MRAHRPFYALLALYLLLASLYSVVTPLFEASDELWHYPMVKYIADSGFTLPVQDPRNPGPMRQEGSQPPLYYLLSAILVSPLDRYDMDEVRHLNPHPDLGVLRPDGNVNIVVHDPAREGLPWRGTVLAAHVVRAFSVLLGALTVAMTYLLALELFPGKRTIALGAAALTAFNPMFLFIGGSINNDNLSTALASVLLWQIVRLVKQQTAPTHRQLVGIGVVAGCGMLAKFNIGFMLPLVAVALALVAHRVRSIRVFVVGAVITGSLTVLIGAWWYIRNQIIYGDPTGLNIFLKIVGERQLPANLPQLWSERHTFLMSYWGFFGGVNVPLPEWVYTVFNGIAAASVAGLIAAVVFRRGAKATALLRSNPDEAPDPPYGNMGQTVNRAVAARRLQPRAPSTPRNVYLLLARAFTALWIAVLFLSLIRWTQSTWASQGRLMFAAIAPISAWMAFGLYTLWPARSRVLAIAAAWFIAVAACAPILIHRTYTDPDFLVGLPAGDGFAMVQQASFRDDTQPGNVLRLGQCCNIPQIVLRGDYLTFDVAFDTDRWTPSPTEWSVFVHLINLQGVIVAQRDVLVRQGLWSTRIMQLGPTRWRNRFSIQIPDNAYAPNMLRIYLGFYDSATGHRMTASSAAGAAVDIQDDAVYIGTVGLPQGESWLFSSTRNPTSVNFADQLELVGYDVSALSIASGQEVTVTLYWRANAKLTTDYSAFVQILKYGTSEVYGGSDGMSKPTSQWQPGEIITDKHTFKIRDDAPPGNWQLQIGAYRFVENGIKRLPIVQPDGAQATDTLLLTNVRIEARP